MTLVLESRHLAALRRCGAAEYPREACGLIGGTSDGERKVAGAIVPVPNARADAAHNRYLIAPEAFRRAQERLARHGLDVVGVYHSHPDHPPEPSAVDRENAWPWLSYVIVEVRRGEVGTLKSWVLADDRAAFVEEVVTLEERIVAWQSQS